MSRAVEVVEGFLPAWLAGDVATVGEPLGPADLPRLTEALDAAAGPRRQGTAGLPCGAPGGRRAEAPVPASLGELRRRWAARLAPADAAVEPTGRDAPAVLVLHNLLSLSDRRLQEPGARPLAYEGAVRFTHAVAGRLRPPREPAGALGAHGLLAPLFEAERLDSEVRFWAGRLRYAGRPVPTRVIAWPAVRGVRVARERVAVLDDLGEAQREILDRLLLWSPLSDLAHPVYRGTDAASGLLGARAFRFGATARWLAEPELARGIIYAWAAAPDPALVGGVLAHAAQVRARSSARSPEVRRIVHALYHLQMVVEIEAAARGVPPAASPGPRLPEGDPRLWQAALFKLLHRGGTSLGLPAPDTLGPDLSARLDARSASLEATDTTAEEHALVSALRPHLDVEIP